MKRSLGVWSLLAAIYFCVSGGAFGLEQVVQLGPGIAVLLILITPIVWSVPAALMTAELSSAIPEEGGYYAWVRRALGQPWGFLSAWWSWLYSWVDVAIYPTLFAAYFGRLLHLMGYSLIDQDNPLLKWALGLIVILPLTALNLRGAKSVGETGVSFLFVLIVPFTLLILLGMPPLLTHSAQAIHPFISSKDTNGVFGIGLFAVMWNYLGWDTMSTVTGEVKDPQRTVVRALAIGVPMVVVFYLLPVLVGVVQLHDTSQWTDGAWVQVAALTGGRWLAIFMALAGMISSAGQFSAMLLAGSRIPFVMAEDGILPNWLTRLHPRYRTPWGAVLVSAVFYTAFSYESFKDLAIVDVILYSASLLLEFLALAVLRKKEPTMPRPFQIPGGWPAIVLVVLAPTALIAFACYSRIEEKGLQVVLASTLALTSGPAIWYLGSHYQRRKQNI